LPVTLSGWQWVAPLVEGIMSTYGFGPPLVLYCFSLYRDPSYNLVLICVSLLTATLPLFIFGKFPACCLFALPLSPMNVVTTRGVSYQKLSYNCLRHPRSPTPSSFFFSGLPSLRLFVFWTTASSRFPPPPLPAVPFGEQNIVSLPFPTDPLTLPGAPFPLRASPPTLFFFSLQPIPF